MPLLLIKNLVVTFHPYSAHADATKKMPNIKSRFVLLLDVCSEM